MKNSWKDRIERWIDDVSWIGIKLLLLIEIIIMVAIEMWVLSHWSD